MTWTNGKAIPSEYEIYHAARIERAKAFAAIARAVTAGIKGWVTRHVIEPIRARNARQRQLEDLLNMDDHMLRDLGLSRGGIAYAFEHGREADPANVNAPLSKHAA